MVERLGATIRNEATGVIDLQGDETLKYNLNVGMPQIQNLGLLKKTAGAGVSRLEAVFDNQGTLRAGTGQLLVAGSLPQAAASVIEIRG